MKRLLEEGELTTDLECAFKALRNVGGFIPVPFPLIGIDDPRMSDARLMLDGSVNNSSVAEDAGIQQGKLNLNGSLPFQWLLSAQREIVTVGALPGPDEPVTGDDGKNVTVGIADPSLYAVPGDEAEYLIHKAQPNGYVPLDANGRMPAVHYPSAANSGTVSFFQLDLFLSYLTPIPDRVSSGAVSMVANWFDLAPGRWLGNVLGEETAPRFSLAPVYPSMIPNLDASKITTEVVTVGLVPGPDEPVIGDDGFNVTVTGPFNHARIPIALGVGPSHAPGAVPDPGLNTLLAADYLARDMTYKTMTDDIPYQTRVPDPSISWTPGSGHLVLITITSPLPGTSLFFRLTDTDPFEPYSGPFSESRPLAVEAYGAKVGYNNSDRVSLIIPPL